MLRIHARPVVLLAVALLTAPLSTGCTGTGESAEPPDDVAVADPTPGFWNVDEAAWLALRGEPRHLLVDARDAYGAGARDEAARDLDAASAMLRLEARRAVESHVGQRLRGAAIEVAEAGREAREGALTDPELGRITARALLAVSEHHRELAGGAVSDGRRALGALHLAESVRQLEHAHVAAGIEVDTRARQELADARSVADRLEAGTGRPDGIPVDSALVSLERNARRLEFALGARRR